MSDQQAPPEAGTPAVAGPEEAPGTQEQGQHGTPEDLNWQKRYLDTQADYTRSQQELRELQERQQLFELAFTSEDPDTQRQALERLGYDIPDEEAEDVESAEFEDPYDELRAEIEELRQWQNEAQTTQAEQRAFEYLNGHVVSEAERLGLEQLDDTARDWVLSRAMAIPVEAPPGAPHHELPDIETAMKEWQDLVTDQQKSWAKTKQRAPYVPSGGLPANEVPNPGTGHDARMDRALRSLHEQELSE